MTNQTQYPCSAEVDERIVKFIKEHHVMTLASVKNSVPYCCNLFYAYDAESNIFVFTSDATTKHGADMLEQGTVACSIVLETKKVGFVQGLQLQGVVEPLGADVPATNQNQPETEVDPLLLAHAKKIYLKKFPYAAVVGLSLWVLRPRFLKLTDNRLGFGKKLLWGEVL